MPKIKIEITMEENGQILVTGPLQDKILMFGILEVARQIVHSYKGDVNSIVKPSLFIPPIRQQ